MIQGFKEFIMKGNVIDLAVAVVIGAAFGALVDGVVKGLIDPIIAGLVNADSIAGATFSIGNIDIGWGLIVSALIHFLAVALIVYLVFVVPMNKYKERQAAKAGVSEEEAALSETDLLLQIRDLLAKQERA